MKNKEQITEIPNFLGRAESAALLKNLFDRRQIWEARKERRVSYRNGDWYTLGSSLYLDLKSEQQYGEYVEKSLYWQSMLNDPTIKPFLDEIRLRLEKNVFGKKTFFLADIDNQGIAKTKMPVGYPGFHIFPGHETASAFFGRKHQDRQHEALFQIPLIKDNFKKENVSMHFSFTIPLRLPYMGGGMLLGSNLEEFYPYKENSLYMHSGHFDHAIAPFMTPVLPSDWRITIQGHGFVYNENIYLYW